MLRVAIFADDLTGALDSVEPFGRTGASVIVAASLAALPSIRFASHDVVAVNLDSRHLEPGAAAAAITKAWRYIAPARPELVFKKLDSRMKGNVVVELRAIAEASGRSEAIVAPAIPLMGRLTRHGEVIGNGVDRPIPITGLEGWLPGWEVPDCPDSGALSEIAKEVIACRETVIAAGASGLAEELSAILFRGDAARPPSKIAVPPCGRKMVMAIGSQDPITVNQIAALTQSDVPLAAMTSGQQLRRVGPHTDLILLRPPDATMEPDKTANELAELALRVAREESISTLLLSGGDTAAAFVSRAGIDHLTPVGALAQGMPVSRGRAAGAEFTLITKSGGFGTIGTLVDAFRNWQSLY